MKKINLLATAFAVAALSFTSVQAAETPAMEQCVVIAKGENIIVKADSADQTSSDRWIHATKAECDALNAGKLEGVSEEVKAKIDTSKLQ